MSVSSLELEVSLELLDWTTGVTPMDEYGGH